MAVRQDYRRRWQSRLGRGQCFLFFFCLGFSSDDSRELWKATIWLWKELLTRSYFELSDWKQSEKCILVVAVIMLNADLHQSNIEHIWQLIWRLGFYRGGPVFMSALSGIDIALWDLKGKERNMVSSIAADVLPSSSSERPTIRTSWWTRPKQVSSILLDWR